MDNVLYYPWHGQVHAQTSDNPDTSVHAKPSANRLVTDFVWFRFSGRKYYLIREVVTVTLRCKNKKVTLTQLGLISQLQL